MGVRHCGKTTHSTSKPSTCPHTTEMRALREVARYNIRSINSTVPGADTLILRKQKGRRWSWTKDPPFWAKQIYIDNYSFNFSAHGLPTHTFQGWVASPCNDHRCSLWSYPACMSLPQFTGLNVYNKSGFKAMGWNFFFWKCGSKFSTPPSNKRPLPKNQVYWLIPPASAVKVIKSVPSVCVCLLVNTLMAEPFGVWTWNFSQLFKDTWSTCVQRILSITKWCPLREVRERWGVFIWGWYHKVCFTFLFSSIMAVDILIDLPPELRASILETLDVCSACKACCVSNKWSDAIENCTPLWRKLCYAHCTKEDIERDLNAGYSWKVLSQSGLCGYSSYVVLNLQSELHIGPCPGDCAQGSLKDERP